MAGLRRRAPAAYLRGFVTGLLLTGVVTGGVGCSEEAADVPSPSQRASAPVEDAANLSNLLVPPSGYVDIDGDPLSGPFDRSGVRYLLAEHPGDSHMVLEHGFVAGFLRGWRAPPSADGSSPVPVTSVTGLVLSFDTPEHARVVLEYFRTNDVADHYELFGVPAALTAGYGVHKADASAGAALGVAWVDGIHLFNVMIMADDPSVARQHVIDLALRQNPR